jgi:Leucine-rich repeat (LRR) protein
LGRMTQLTSLAVHNNTQLAGTIPSILCSVSNLTIQIDCANIVCTCCMDYSGNTSCPVSAPTLVSLPNQAPQSSPIRAITPTTWSPTKAPTAILISASPSKAPARLILEEELSVACNFLNISSLSVCQATPIFEGRTMGNTIPTELGLLTQFTYLSLIENQLTGTIPSTLGNLVQLTVLYLSINELTGTLPSTLGNLMNLTDLSVFENHLTGTVPSTLGQLTQLTYLDLGSNQLSGIIPLTLCSVSSVSIYIDCANITCTCCVDSCS